MVSNFLQDQACETTVCNSSCDTFCMHLTPAIAQLLLFLECSTTRYLCVSLSRREVRGWDHDKNYAYDKMSVSGASVTHERGFESMEQYIVKKASYSILRFLLQDPIIQST